ncbi:MAG: AMP-dependent synthetase/ligase [Candidatus Marinamargulisbacteria bacterium]
MNSVLDILYHQVLQRPHQPALYYLDTSLMYQPITYQRMAGMADQFSLALNDWISPGDNVVIWANNGWQWAISDISIQLSDGVSVPIYPTIGGDQLAYILDDAQPSVIITDAQTPEQWDQLSSLSYVKKVIVISASLCHSEAANIIDFDSACARYPMPETIGAKNWQKDRRKSTLTMLYTSGTTGLPKAVPLTHNNIVENFLGLLSVIPITSDDASISFLPLSHIFERTVGFFCVLGVGGRIYYAESIETLSRDLLIAKPSFIISVPRLYEKVYHSVWAKAKGLKRGLLTLAVAIGQRWPRPHWLGRMAHRIVFAKIHEKLGGNVRFLVTGGAPISRVINTFFDAIGLPVVQGYGLTETSPIITANFDGVIGSVGKPLKNVQVRILDDGEVCVHGPSVFSGYQNTNNQGVFTDDGFFKTGDLGRWDNNGYLYITGRKKELIILSNGKNVAPNHVEDHLIQSSYIQQVVVVGDQRHYLVALVVIDVMAVSNALGCSFSMTDSEVYANAVQHILTDCRRLSVPLARFETIKKVAILTTPFSIDGGELTPTLKYRRSEINKKYASQIAALYDK